MSELNELMELSKNNIQAVSVLIKSVGDLQHQSAKTTQKIKEIEEDVYQLKFNEEISDSQAGIITSMVKQLAKETTGYPSVIYRYAIHDIYKHLTERCGMGNKVRTTKKGQFETVLEGIRNYKPDINKLEQRCTNAQKEEIKKISQQLESERY